TGLATSRVWSYPTISARLVLQKIQSRRYSPLKWTPSVGPLEAICELEFTAARFSSFMLQWHSAVVVAVGLWVTLLRYPHVHSLLLRRLRFRSRLGAIPPSVCGSPAPGEDGSRCRI